MIATVKWPPFAKGLRHCIMGKGKKSGNAGLGKSLIKDATRGKRFSGGASWVRREVVRGAWQSF